MALVVEDGSGKADAESYQSVAGHRAYCIARGLTAPADDATIEQRARIATTFMVGRYRARWRGLRVSGAQALDWPRTGVEVTDTATPGYLPVNIVPAEVVAACSELIIRLGDGPLSPDVPRLESKIELGPLKVEYTDGPALTSFTAVDALLGSLISSRSPAMVKLVRC